MTSLEQLGRDLETRLRLLTEHTRDIMYRYRLVPTRGFEYVSPAVTPITGYTPEEHYADPDLGLQRVHPEDRSTLQRMIADGSTGPVTVRFVRKDGAVIWIEHRHVSCFDAAGQLIALEGVAREITERQQAEEALAAETRFRRAQSAVAEVASSSLQPDVLAARLIEAIARAQGYAYGALWRLAEGANQAVIVATYGEHTISCRGFRLKLSDTRSIVARALQLGQPIFHNRVQDSPLANHPLSQMLRPQALLVLPLVHRRGAVIGALAFGDATNPERFTGRDLTEGALLARQVTQVIEHSDLSIQVQQLQERWRVVTESISDALYTVDVRGRVTFGNTALERLTGYGMEELLGRPSTMFFAPGAKSMFAERRRRARRGEAVFPPVEVELIRKDGRRVPVELSVANLVQHGRIAGRVAIVRDITERKCTAEKAERQRREAEVLAELARTLNVSLDLDTVLVRVVEGAKELCHSDVALIALRELGSGAMTFRHMVGGTYQAFKDVPIEPGKGVGGQVLLTGRPFRTDNYRQDPRISQDDIDMIQAEGVVSVMAVPIRIGARVEGLLYVDNHAARPFSDHDEAILLQLAEHAAIAIQNARLFEASERRRRAAEGLADVERLLSQSLVPEEVGQRIVDSVRTLFGALSAALLRLEPISGDFTVVAASGDVGANFGQDMSFPGGTGVVGLAVRERQPVATPNLLTDPRLSLRPERRASIEQAPYRAVLAIPLIYQDRIIGALGITDRAGRAFAREEIKLAQAFADQAAIALQNAHLYQELQRAYDKLSQTQDQLIHAQKMEAVGRLAGGIAHDFNNLLTVIMGRADLVLSRLRGKDRLRRHLQLILSAADGAASLTRHLLAFSRRQVLQPTVIDLNAVVVNVSTMLRWLIGEDIQVSIVLAPGLGRAKADAGQLEQVLLNLAVNARDAMPQGGQLCIETANVEVDEADARDRFGVRAGRYVRLTVRDTGYGMDADTQAHIFEPFFTTKGPGQGTGLGLSTVYGIIAQSGGHIEVHSTPGQGTTFTIDLPRIEDPTAASEPLLPQIGPPQGTETILLAEDEAPVRGLAREVLQMLGYTVLEAASGEEALQRCQQHAGPVHLLVTDVVMPGMSGPELAERLASTSSALKVLYLTGYADDAVAHHGVLEPGTSLLHKPFTPDALARRVREVLDK
jgi:PAS domain S-box-containing protein